MTKITTLLLLLCATIAAQAQNAVCWYTPTDATQGDEITIYYDATQGNAPFKDTTSDIYAYTGVVSNTSNGAWTHVKWDSWNGDGSYPDDCLMTRVEGESNLYSLTITPQTFYNLDPSEQILKLCFLFRIKDSTEKGGADSSGSDIYLSFGTSDDDEEEDDDDSSDNSDVVVGQRTLYFCGDWSATPYVYIYDESSDLVEYTGSWPGTLMTLCADADGWYYYTLPAEIGATAQVIFNTGVNGSDRYPGDNEPGVYLNFSGTEGWYLLSTHTFYTENPGSTSTTTQLGAFRRYDISSDGYTCQIYTENGTLFITSFNDYVIKVFSLPLGSTAVERESITVSAYPEAKINVTDDTDESLVLSTAATSIIVDKSNCTLKFADTDGNVILSEYKGLDNFSSTRSVTFRPMGDVAFYGGGYNGQRIDQDGTTITMRNTQTGNWTSATSAPHNICIPFFVSTSGYGLLFDDHYYNSKMTPSSAGTSYSSKSPDPIAYYYVGSDGTMESVLENYTFLTGRQELPPYWALGYISSRYGYTSRSEAESVVSKIKNDCAMPLDAIVFDIYWQGRVSSIPYMMGRLDWDTSAFPSPSEMMADFKTQGINTILITEPFFTYSCGNYSTLNNNGYFSDSDVSNMSWLGSSPVGLLDITNPDALDWMWSFYKARTDEGVDGWWLDLGEPEQHDSESTYQGGTMQQVHNEYGNRWIEMVYNGLKENYPDRRHILLPRAGTSGMQRFSTFPWTGDIQRSWSGLEAQIPALISSGMSGVAYMGSDVGGFIASSNNETLYRRWVEFATFSPVFRTHSQADVASLSGKGPEPFLYSSAAQESMRDFLNKRYAFLPYTYTLAYENAVKGTPMARPLNFYEPTNESIAGCTSQYLWGKDLLIAPVLAETDTRTVTFPDGRWVDMNNYENIYDGGSSTSYYAPLGTLPHFARVGSIIPRYTQSAYANTSSIEDSDLTLLYFADLTKDEYETDLGYMFDDNKTSPTSIDDGEYSILRFSASHADDSNWLLLSSEGNGYDGMTTNRKVTVIAPNFDRAVTIGLKRQHNGDNYTDTPLTIVSTKEAFDAADENVLYISADNTLMIKTTWDSSVGAQALYFNASTTSLDNITVAAEAIDIRTLTSDGRLMLAYDITLYATEAVVNLFDISGAAVASIGNLDATRGTHTTEIPALLPGFYIARLTVDTPAGQRTVSRKIRLR